MTGKMLKQRGRCCKSACLHCPYGFTLKKHGLKFLDAGSSLTVVNELAGKEIPSDELDYYKLFTLKDEVAGLVKVNHIQVKEFYLHEEFQDQGLTKEIVESYYFY